MQRYTVYFIWKLLYMFRVVPSPIIRSANNCVYSTWYLSHRYCYLPLSWKSRNRFECAVGGVRKYSNMYPTRCNVTQFILSGNCSTCFGWYHHPSSGEQKNCVYSTWYLSHRYCYLPLSWKRWNWFECAVGGERHPQHTQTGSNSSTIAADSSNGVTNTRCCRHSFLSSWWWVMVPPETCRAVSR